jgi:quercetin dioxygenase-like cupin family protein
MSQPCQGHGHLFSRLLAATVIAGAVALSPGLAGEEEHTILAPDEIEWADGPASLAAGSQFAVLHGDPSAEGMFAMRLRLPPGFHIAPHTHSQPEIVTVISGTFHIGMGAEADIDKAVALGPGGFFAFPPGMVHFAYADAEEGAVVQLNSTGPWTIEYVDPEDDPRR